MPDKLNQISSFVQIATYGSLSSAAKNMGLSLGAVSKRLTQLETRLGVTLLHRNTRAISLTERGQTFFDRASRLLAEIETAEQEISSDSEALAGSLRITATVEFGRRRLAPLLQEFRLMHPDLRIHLDTIHQPSNPIEGGYDLAIWVGDLPDSSLIVRRLAANRRVICAAPDYLQRRGAPRDLAELAQHDCIVVGPAGEFRWQLANGQMLRLQRPLSTNDLELAHTWAIGGAGLAIRSVWDVEDDVAAGRLQVVLPHVALPDSAVSAVYPKSRDAAAKVRGCIGFLSERLKATAPAI
jgi:DNA-binding transcriptional LysR family regulator